MVYSISLAAQGASLWLDPLSVNAAIMNMYKSANEKYLQRTASKRKFSTKKHEDSSSQAASPSGVYRASPVSLAKAVKNLAELEGMQNSHLRYFFIWFCVILLNSLFVNDLTQNVVKGGDGYIVDIA